jgi:hypothetical protein
VPVHSADCALCRVIASGAKVSRAPVVQVLPECAISTPLPQYHGLAAGTLAQRDPSQRAPPLL